MYSLYYLELVLDLDFGGVRIIDSYIHSFLMESDSASTLGLCLLNGRLDLEM